MSEDVKVYFVIRKDCEDEVECSEEMKLAFVTCEQHRGGGLQAQWVKETDLTQFSQLTKRDVFVVNEFAGEIYEQLKSTKCLLVGPRCLSCCLTEGTPIPSGPEPVFTVAMRGLIISASGLSKQQKEHIKRRVQWMGGLYTNVLTDDTTHLVSDTVLSDKYIKSVEKDIPIMNISWIDAVWDASLCMNVHATSSDFQGHRLPPFFNLQVTSSGISKREKQLIMKLVKENGGTFSGAFQSEMTDVVVLTKEGIGSEKYKAAIEYGKACVLPGWVTESAKRGLALPMCKFRVAGASTSSPIQAHPLPDMSLNFSRITNMRPPNNVVDETRSSDITSLSNKFKMSQEARKSVDALDRDVQNAFENIDMSVVKKAGNIFDGFCIWVAGPEGSWREKASTLISRGGGVRFEQPHGRVTHTIVGSKSAGLAAAIKTSVPVILASWLTDSLARGSPLDETDYLIETKHLSPRPKSPRKPGFEPASPMSARNIQLLRREPLPPPPPPDIEPVSTREQDHIVNQYLSQNLVEPIRERNPDPPETSKEKTSAPEVTNDDDVTEDASEEIEQVFKDLTFAITGIEEEAIGEIVSCVESAGGSVARGNTDYVVAPLEADAQDPLRENWVTVFWLKDCISQGELVSIEYYHRPVVINNSNVPLLPGVVASLSTYTGLERAFLDALAHALGAETQLRFCRRTTPTAKASTHLICPAPGGDKYLGAVKWGLPAVTGAWLLACAKEGRRVPENYFLVGDSKAPQQPEHQNDNEEQKEKEDSRTKNNEETDREENNQNLCKAVTEKQPEVIRRGSTPSAKKQAEDEMSPASRYIAMARQGLLGLDSQETPKRVADLKEDANKEGEQIRTPPLDDALATPNLTAFSPTTRRRLQALKRGEMPSDTIKTPADPFKKIETPDSEFGAALRPGAGKMSPEARKRLWKFVNELPSKEQPVPVRDKQTPLSEIRNRFLAQFNSDAPTPPSEHSIAPRKLHLQEQADTPPAKLPKFSVDQSPGTASHIKSVETPHSMPKASPVRQLANNTTSQTNTPSHHSIGPASASKANSKDSSLPSMVEAQLDRLSAALSGRVSSPAQRLSRPIHRPTAVPGAESEPAVESQPNTVGWDDTTPAPASAPAPAPASASASAPAPASATASAPAPAPASASASAPAPASATADNRPTQTDCPLAGKRFMLSSNVDNRDELISTITNLGGSVCEGAEVDSTGSHLLCAAPSRSEKMLGAVAAGKWVLHPAYVIAVLERGVDVTEEEFEWGNPLATSLPTLSGGELALALAAHRWRVVRGRGGDGAFSGVRALVHAPAARRRLLRRLITSGGGDAPDLLPPYEDDTITVCFADTKRCPLSARDATWLRERAIPVCAPVALSALLTDQCAPDLTHLCLPHFKPQIRHHT